MMLDMTSVVAVLDRLAEPPAAGAAATDADDDDTRRAASVAAFLFPPLERSTEPLSAVLARTAHLLAEDHGDVICEDCGAHRSIGRRVGDGGRFVCLAGCSVDDRRNRAAHAMRVVGDQPTPDQNSCDTHVPAVGGGL